MVSDDFAGAQLLESISLNPCSNGIWSLTLTSVSRWLGRSQVLILVLMEYGLWQCGQNHNRGSVNVLILVLMEYGLWLPKDMKNIRAARVLILVLMEYGLWRIHGGVPEDGRQVLILVLMEYGLWPHTTQYAKRRSRLNPCSNGIWSLTTEIKTSVLIGQS